MANKPYPTPANLSEQLVNLGWRLATEMRALYNTANTKISKEDADAAYLGKTAKAVSAKTADVATKATQDGNGKVIADTYALKSAIPVNMTGASSSAAGKAGLVPAPVAGNQGKYLRGDGTWQTPANTTYSTFKAATSTAAGGSGLVPAPVAGKQASYLRGDGQWATPPNTTYKNFTGSTASAAGTAGLVPAPVSGKTAQVLRSNGQWTDETVQTTVSGNAGTATKLQTARSINGVDFDGTSDISITKVETSQRVTALANTTSADYTGVQMYEVYNNNYPTSYGNLLHLKGASAPGEGEFLIGWSGTSGANAPVYVRSRRDSPEAKWSSWAQVFTSADNIPASNVATFKGASSSTAGSAGVLPAPTAGSQNKYLRGDGTWHTVSTSIPNYTFTASTQGGRIVVVNNVVGTIDTTTNSGSGHLTSTTYSFSTTPGIAAGTYSIQSILQQLINLSHSHKTAKGNTNYNCNCDCNCSSTSGDTDG